MSDNEIESGIDDECLLAGCLWSGKTENQLFLTPSIFLGLKPLNYISVLQARKDLKSWWDWWNVHLFIKKIIKHFHKNHIRSRVITCNNVTFVCIFPSIKKREIFYCKIYQKMNYLNYSPRKIYSISGMDFKLIQYWQASLMKFTKMDVHNSQILCFCFS